MGLFEYECLDCHHLYEVSHSHASPWMGPCPKCRLSHSKRRLSLFAVGGRGDQRESTMHGCHEHFDGLDHGDSDHDHAEEHINESIYGPSGTEPANCD